MMEILSPVEFIETILKTFPRYYWGNQNSDTEAWIGIKSLGQVRFERSNKSQLHLYLNNEFVLSKSYPENSKEDQLIRQVIFETRKYFALPKNSSYQNFYYSSLIKQSEEIIRYYFKEVSN